MSSYVLVRLEASSYALLHRKLAANIPIRWHYAARRANEYPGAIYHVKSPETAESWARAGLR